MTDLAAHLNGLSESDLAAVLHRCCGSGRWVEQLRKRAPFDDPDAVHAAADQIWWALEREDWFEAFAAHPRIGASGVEDRWARAEQSGSQDASADVLVGLARGNVAYEERYGFIFIICASGLGAEEMLGALEARLENSPEEELRTAAAEQAKITRLLLDRLVKGA